MTDFTTIMGVLIEGDEAALVERVNEALQEGADPREILDHALIAGMDIVGERMETGEMFIPEVLMAARAMNAALEIIKPLLTGAGARAAGKVVIGTVRGDLHDIGKNLVTMMLESAGLEVYNLGADVAPEQFVEALKSTGAGLLCLSALLTTTMPMIRQTIEAVVQSGIRDRVKIMVGGAPVTEAFAREIGADGYAADAGSAVKMAKALLAGSVV